MEAVMDRRYDLVNPVLGEFLEEEKKFFTLSAIAFKKLDNVVGKFKGIAQKIIKKSSNYDPCKYIRGGELIKRDKSQPINDENKRSGRKEQILFENDDFKPRSKSNLPVNKETSNKYNKEMKVTTITNNNFNDTYFDDGFSNMTNKFSNNKMTSNNMQIDNISQK
jgi:hypothetical protein